MKNWSPVTPSRAPVQSANSIATLVKPEQYRRIRSHEARKRVRAHSATAHDPDPPATERFGGQPEHGFRAYHTPAREIFLTRDTLSVILRALPTVAAPGVRSFKHGSSLGCALNHLSVRKHAKVSQDQLKLYTASLCVTESRICLLKRDRSSLRRSQRQPQSDTVRPKDCPQQAAKATSGHALGPLCRH
jgi:hypothetical protein